MITLPNLPFGLDKPAQPAAPAALANSQTQNGKPNETREAFQKFVAGTFFKQMLKSMRNTLGKPAYFHGGQAEEIFRGQMDQEVAEQLAAKRGGSMSESLFKAFATRLKIDADSQTRQSQSAKTADESATHPANSPPSSASPTPVDAA